MPHEWQKREIDDANELLSRKRLHKFQVIKVVRSLQVFKAVFAKFSEQRQLVEQVKLINRAGLLITRNARRFLRRKGRYPHRRQTTLAAA